jgi:hypothetical protein
LQPQPLFPLKDIDLIPKTWVTFEKCALCGLRFALIWGVRFVSFNHVCHDWCVVYHFGTSSKCVQQGCEEEMHEAWWRFFSYKKPDFLVSIEDGSIDTIKLLTQPSRTCRGGALFLVSFIQ